MARQVKKMQTMNYPFHSFCCWPLITALFTCLLPGPAIAQPPIAHPSTAQLSTATSLLTIEKAWMLAEKNYPQTAERQLLQRSRDYSIANAAKGWLPQLNFSGQATLQSDVTNLPFKIPIAGFSLPTYSKDQYKIYGEVDQTIYDGGLIRNQRQSAQVDEQIREKNLDVELYALRDRINQLFFGILLLDQQLRLNGLLQADIVNGIDKTQALLDNGMAYRSGVDELKAQLLQTDQQRIEEMSTRKAYLDMLGLFVGLQLDTTIVLASPPVPDLTDSVRRPELLWYDLQKKNYDLQDALTDADLRPHVGFFLQGGYARPGLNLLSNNFEWYYIGGVRLTWSLGGLYTHKNQRRLSDIGRKTLNIEKETFLFNTHLSQHQDNEEIRKYSQLLQSDARIIILRTNVKHVAYSQLAEGVLSAHDFLTEVDAEDQARQAYIVHQIQWMQAQYNYQNLTGNQP
jgi:outer membrane protein TolC